MHGDTVFFSKTVCMSYNLINDTRTVLAVEHLFVYANRHHPGIGLCIVEKAAVKREVEKCLFKTVYINSSAIGPDLYHPELACGGVLYQVDGTGYTQYIIY